MVLSDARSSGPAYDFVSAELGGSEEEDNNAAVDSLCIYRRLRWGRLLDAVITDNRSYRSPHCLPAGLHKQLGLPMNAVKLVEIADGGREYRDGNPPEFLPYGDGDMLTGAAAACRHDTGEAQKAWFLDQLKESGATWKVWGNAMPALPFHIDLSELPSPGHEDSLSPSIHGTVTPTSAQPARVHRQRRDNGGCVLSGDHHLHAAGLLRARRDDPDTAAVCAEFVTTCISAESMYEDAFVTGRNNDEFAPLVYRLENGEEIPVWNLTLQDGVAAALAYQVHGAQALPRTRGTDIRYVTAPPGAIPSPGSALLKSRWRWWPWAM